MNNNSDLPGIAVNIAITAVVLAVIILGLNRMGLYNLPSWIENVVNPDNYQDNNANVDDSMVYESVGYDISENTKVEKTSLTYENARQILEKIEVSRDYYHELSINLMSEGKTRSSKVVINKLDGMYSADIYNKSGRIIKSIENKNDSITVKEYTNERVTGEFSYPSGNFTVWELAGVIVDHENFLSGDYALEEGDFSVIYGDFGAELEIVFDTVMEEYSQHEVYRVNVDYGVVTNAQCYENDELVYEMNTVVLQHNS